MRCTESTSHPSPAANAYASMIIRIEAAHGGRHSILHTADRAVEVMASVSQLEKQYGDLLLRCHQSYLVNPAYISSIRRFKLILTDGTELPVPEKKFTAVRDRVIKAERRFAKG